MKKLRFFGLLVTVVLLAFGLALGCSNGSTDGEETSEPERTTTYIDEANQVEIIFSNRTIAAAKARAVQNNDYYSIKKAGTEVSKGYVELGPNGVFIFHPTGGDGTFQGVLSGSTLTVPSIPVAGGGTISATATAPGSPPTGGNTGGGGGGGGGGGSGGGGGLGGGTGGIGGGTGGGVSNFVPVTDIVLTGNHFVKLTGSSGAGGGSLILETRVVPSNASNQVITWTGTAGGTLATATATVTTTAGVTTLAIGGTTDDDDNKGQYTIVTAVIPNGAAGTGTDTNFVKQFLIPIVASDSKVNPPKISLTNSTGFLTISGGATAVVTDGWETYVVGKTKIKIEPPAGHDAYFLVGTDDTATTAVAGARGKITTTTFATTASAGVKRYDTAFPLDFEAVASATDIAATAIGVRAYNGTNLSDLITLAFQQAVATVKFVPDETFVTDKANPDPAFVYDRSTIALESVPGAKIYYRTAGAAITDTVLVSDAPYGENPIRLNAATIGAVTAGTQKQAHFKVLVKADGYLDFASADTQYLQAKINDLEITLTNGGIPAAESASAGTNPIYAQGVTTFRISSDTTGLSTFYAFDKTVANVTGITNITQYNALTGVEGKSGYTAPVPITSADNTYVIAYATKTGYMDQYQFTPVPFEQAKAKTPTVSPNGATITSGGWSSLNSVKIESDTKGATIYYSTDGTTPSIGTGGTLSPNAIAYTGPINLSRGDVLTTGVGTAPTQGLDLYAIATRAGFITSDPMASAVEFRVTP